MRPINLKPLACAVALSRRSPCLGRSARAEEAAARRHDAVRHPDDHRPAERRRRRQPHDRHHALRRAHQLEAGRRQGAGRARAGARDGVERRSQGQHAVDLQAAQGRQVSRRIRFHRGRRHLESRQALQEGLAAVRSAPDSAGRRAHHVTQELAQDRRLYGRVDDGHAGLDIPVPALGRLLLEPRPVREARPRLEQVRRAALGHRTVPARAPGAARARGDGAKFQLLGPEARRQIRAAGAAADPRADHACLRAALGPGRPGRSAAARFRAAPEGAGIRRHVQHLPALLAVLHELP